MLEFLILRLKQILPIETKIMGTGSGIDGLRLAHAHIPYLVILDLSLPDISGFKVATDLAALRPPPRILVLSSSGSNAALGRISYCPIHGLMLKSHAYDAELSMALRELLSGRTYYQQPALVAIATARRRHDHFLKILSPREVELVSLFGFGWTHTTIASHIGLSPETIRTHHQNILRKLNLHSREELMRWAIMNGFTDFREEPDVKD